MACFFLGAHDSGEFVAAQARRILVATGVVVDQLPSHVAQQLLREADLTRRASFSDTGSPAPGFAARARRLSNLIMDSGSAVFTPDSTDSSTPGGCSPPRVSARRMSISMMAEWHESVTVLYADVVGFTDMSRDARPDAIMAMLNTLYTRLDAEAERLRLYKVEIIGARVVCVCVGG
jgi:hypothetical protein